MYVCMYVCMYIYMEGLGQQKDELAHGRTVRPKAMEEGQQFLELQ